MFLARTALLFLLAPLVPAQQWDVFGTGCPGTVGVPVLDAAPGSLPHVGCPFTLQLSNLPAGADTFVVVGFSKTIWGALPLPYDLSQIGLFGCTLYVSTDAIAMLPTSGGAAEMTIPVPNKPIALNGVKFYTQALVVDSGPNAIGVVTNAGEAVIGPTPVFNLAGTWQLTSTSGTNTCGDPVDVDTVFDVEITDNGGNLTVVTPVGTLTGPLTGCSMELTGDTFVDGGVADNTLNLTVSLDGMSVTGTNTWSWTDGNEVCTGVDTINAFLK